ncbi:hypothetical protein CCR94_10740 [Rhodoblastus sphagnicola]|uniref:Tyr recombinase domain-containing protein n=2 Tax=Rhodoblastus sphagnicola TaxID=333368 RepID=A0A2S6N8L1_9HYPH|nr:hypothetical protein CCR94_10740 [Rhodoblastus sphagnicola]
MEEKVRQGEFDFGDAGRRDKVPPEPTAFLKEMAQLFAKALETLKREAPPFPELSPRAMQSFALFQEGGALEREIRLGAGTDSPVAANADLLRADLKYRMQAFADAAKAGPAVFGDMAQIRARGVNDTGASAPVVAGAVEQKPVVVSPVAAVAKAAPAKTPQPQSDAPLFSAALADYLDLREGAGEEKGTISTARMRAEVFVAVMGDRPIDQYLPFDLQKFINEAQHLPLAYGKEMPESSTVRAIGPKAAIGINKKDNCWERLTRKTMEDGYLPAIKAVINYAVRLHPMRHPFGNMRLIWPKQLRPSATREGLDAERLNEVFRIGIASGFSDDALLPALAQTSSRRLGLLAYLRGSDFQTKHGVTIVRIDGVAFDSQKGRWYRAPYKTTDSLNFFVLHKMWDECGFTDWAKEQGDAFIFRQLHACADPADAASKRCGRLLKKAGAIGCNIEVPHALRHGAKDAMVDAAIDGETRRKQMGQSTRMDVHDDYGSNRSLTRAECQRLAQLPLMEAVDWSVFKGLDFEAMASKVRKGGRPKKVSTAS